MLDVKKSCMGKRFTKNARQKIDCNITKYQRLICIKVDSTLELTCQKRPLVEFWCGIQKKAIITDKVTKRLCPCLTTKLRHRMLFIFFNQHSMLQQIGCRSSRENPAMSYSIGPKIRFILHKAMPFLNLKIILVKALIMVKYTWHKM